MKIAQVILDGSLRSTVMNLAARNGVLAVEDQGWILLGLPPGDDPGVTLEVLKKPGVPVPALEF